MHYLARLVVHFHLLLGVVGVGHHVYLRNDVVGQLMGELLDGRDLSLGHYLAILLLQLGHGGRPGTAGTLIGRHVHATDVTELLDGLQHYDHHNGGTIRVGYDATGALQGIGRIDLGHHQGHIRIHTESTRVVYHHGTVLGDGIGKLLRGATTS